MKFIDVFLKYGTPLPFLPFMKRVLVNQTRQITIRSKHITSNKSIYFCACIAVILATPLFGTTLYEGTYYAAIFSNDFLVVAIDSRSTNSVNPSTPPLDRFCKVIPLSDNIIFFAAGFVKAEGTGDFDAESIAREIYALSPRPVTLTSLIQQWDYRMEPIYNRIIAADKNITPSLKTPTVIKGFFAGMDTNNRIALAYARSEPFAGKSHLLSQRSAVMLRARSACPRRDRGRGILLSSQTPRTAGFVSNTHERQHYSCSISLFPHAPNANCRKTKGKVPHGRCPKPRISLDSFVRIGTFQWVTAIPNGNSAPRFSLAAERLARRAVRADD